MNLFPLIVPLLLFPLAESACINCGGANKTSAKRLKMPNKSVFTRLAGIELMEIFEITNQINHEVCAQQCDAHAECAVFEFNLPNKLCVLASEYARLSEDLAKGAFETIVFVKVRGKFTKALPKDKETCLDKSEYEDYVKHEVDKWLNPTPKKSSSSAPGSSSGSPTTGSDLAQTSASGSASTVSTATTTTGSDGSDPTSGANSSAGTTTSGGTQGSTTGPSNSPTDTNKAERGSSENSISPTRASTHTSTVMETAAGATSSGPMPTPSTAAETPTTATTLSAATSTVPLVSASPSSAASRSETSPPSTTMVTEKREDGVSRSTEGSTQSSTDLDTTADQSTSPPADTTTEDKEKPSTTEASSEQPSTTTANVGEVSTNSQPSTSDGPEVGGDGPIGKWRIKSVGAGKYVRMTDKGLVDLVGSGNSVNTEWDIQKSDKQQASVVMQSLANGGFLPAVSLGGFKPVGWNAWTPSMNDDETWSFSTAYGRWLTTDGKIADLVWRVNEPLLDSEKFVLEKI